MPHHTFAPGVDDFISYKPVRARSACSGLEGGCPVCLENPPQAEAADASWVELCCRPGAPLRLDGRQRCRQPVGRAGFPFDTLRGLLLMLPDSERLKQLLVRLRESAESQGAAARFVDSVK